MTATHDPAPTLQHPTPGTVTLRNRTTRRARQYADGVVFYDTAHSGNGKRADDEVAATFASDAEACASCGATDTELTSRSGDIVCVEADSCVDRSNAQATTIAGEDAAQAVRELAAAAADVPGAVQRNCAMWALEIMISLANLTPDERDWLRCSAVDTYQARTGVAPVIATSSTYLAATRTANR